MVTRTNCGYVVYFSGVVTHTNCGYVVYFIYMCEFLGSFIILPLPPFGFEGVNNDWVLQWGLTYTWAGRQVAFTNPTNLVVGFSVAHTPLYSLSGGGGLEAKACPYV